MIYLGTIGRLVGIKCPASLSVENEERYSFTTTLEGHRQAQVKPRGPRTWQLQTSDATRPYDVSALMQFAQGSWGPGPFVFVSADAPFTNLLSPAAASCDPELAALYGSQPDGPMLTPDGWAGRSLRMSQPSDVLWSGSEFIPVLPGRRVTGSAYITGQDAAVRLHWHNSAGEVIGSALSAVKATAGTVVRSWVSALPPAGAVSCRLWSINTVQGSMPAITWTDELVEYADGQGCPQAVVHATSRSLTLTGVGRTYSNLSYIVTEVG